VRCDAVRAVRACVRGATLEDHLYPTASQSAVSSASATAIRTEMGFHSERASDSSEAGGPDQNLRPRACSLRSALLTMQ
jgi:hypothetical protein